jgi:hypothetical protein
MDFLKGLDMKASQLIAFLGVMTMSMNVLAEGGGDRTFEKMFKANTQAMEQYAARLGKPAPVVEDYRYGMTLDVVKVVSVVRPAKGCSVAPAAMTFEDSRGQLKTLRYLVAGECRKQGG